MMMPTMGIHRAIRVHWIIRILRAIGIHRITHAALPPAVRIHGAIRVHWIVRVLWAIRVHRITHAVPPGRVSPAIVEGVAPAPATEYQADDRPQYSQKDEHKHQPYKSHDKHEENEQWGRHLGKQIVDLTQPVGHSILLSSAESRFE
jgi:hypothetical protein